MVAYNGVLSPGWTRRRVDELSKQVEELEKMLKEEQALSNHRLKAWVYNYEKVCELESVLPEEISCSTS